MQRDHRFLRFDVHRLALQLGPRREIDFLFRFVVDQVAGFDVHAVTVKHYLRFHVKRFWCSDRIRLPPPYRCRWER